MIFKLIILAAVVYGIYVLFFKNGNILEKMKEAGKPSKDEEVDTVVECSKCGTYVSTDEAIIKEGKYYCCKECAGIK